jgi:hypothetical protein
MSNEIQQKQLKKRGRKPKGGKIISNVENLKNNTIKQNNNIILHLNCNKYDVIKKDNTSGNDNCNDIMNSHNKKHYINPYQLNKNNNSNEDNTVNHNMIENNHLNKSELSEKNLFLKLNELAYNLHTNNINENNSSCFWCTCNFDNPPIYIPESNINDIYNCYGSFCTPECAVGYLFKENIDSSTKFERYYLINYIYSKVYNYKKNIKPAPSPYYLLNKFNGTLTIEEYRKLLDTDRLILVVDKPLTRNFPELYEDNNDLNINIINTNNYKINYKIKQNKNDIVIKQFCV